jgi:hypothetical protein
VATPSLWHGRYFISLLGLLCLLQAAGLVALMAKLAEIISQERLQNSDHHWAMP